MPTRILESPALRNIMRSCSPAVPGDRPAGPCVYLLPVALMALALAIRLAIAPVNAGLQYVTFFPAVAIAAILGGARAGLIATALGLAFATCIFTPPYFTLSLGVLRTSFWSNLVFLADGLIVSYAIEAMHQYRQQFANKLVESKTAEQQTSVLNEELRSTVAELKKAEGDLRVAAIAFESDQAIIVTDARADIIRVNHAFETITGYSEAEVLGKNPRILSSGRHDKDFYRSMWRRVLDSGSWKGELWDRHKSGSIYPKEMTLTAIRDPQGEISNFIAVFSNISERKKREAEIHNLAYYDSLTQLPNRRFLLEKLSHALAMSARMKQHGAVLFIDLDNFKTLNDTLGHDHGDLLLIQIAERLKQCVRDMDTVARLGGDEFVVLLESFTAKVDEASLQIAQIAEKIRSVLITSYQLNNHRHLSSPSIGVCMFFGDSEPVAEIIKRADTAMYHAKISGRNRVRFFDPAMQHVVQERAELESDLRHALTAGQLNLHYQIQIDHQQRPVGAEALIRWQHPTRGMVSPGQFIPIAEESHLIVDIGDWVLETACRQLATWKDDKHARDIKLAVNTSAKQFRETDFVDKVRALIARHGIDPSRLKLELTESVALNDLETVIQKMARLRNEVGVTLSLDDFGTGYSSLSYLKRFPLDQVKIDQSFVRDITTDVNDTVMVKTIIDLANNFGLEVVAEGVETPEQFAFLRASGCRMFQGYLFGRPMPLDAFDTQLRELSPRLRTDELASL